MIPFQSLGERRRSPLFAPYDVGPAGIGKTRLATEVAMCMSDDFESGVLFISLVTLRQPDQILPTIAQAINVDPSDDSLLFARIASALQSSTLLMVLDNFEQIIPASHHLNHLLSSCQKLKLLVTSREVLFLRSERLFHVGISSRNSGISCSSAPPSTDPSEALGVPTHPKECPIYCWDLYSSGRRSA
jgi:Cdc6-like AAA superfamily ATPase